jgi:hydrogenase small subunit
MGCKGPSAFHNCPVVRWNQATNWPIGCGHPCIGCSEPKFWDKMTPFYSHLRGVPGFNVAASVDRVGLLATAGLGVAFAGYGVVNAARLRAHKRERAEAPYEEPTEREPKKPEGESK